MCAGAVTRVWLVSSFWHIFVIVPILSVFDKENLELSRGLLLNINTLSTEIHCLSTHL
ncbi:MAG: hypothetical protein JWO55_533 [Candidatus Saccharibacteria bacterium]|jgi:hypothetical protein|nr:hypothetical protein [Candidatus Saccharibacteria bacterium]